MNCAALADQKFPFPTTWTVWMELPLSERTRAKPSPMGFSERVDQQLLDPPTKADLHFSEPPPNKQSPMGFPEWSDLKPDDRPA
jgi:hypothetical protein